MALRHQQYSFNGLMFWKGLVTFWAFIVLNVDVYIFACKCNAHQRYTICYDTDVDYMISK